MSRSTEHNRIYIDSAYSGINLGYIEIEETKAWFIGKTQTSTKSSSSFLSFSKANDQYFIHSTNGSSAGRISQIGGSSTQSHPLDYPHDLCVDNYDATCDASNSCDTVTSKTRYFAQQSVKTISIFYNNNWYFPIVEAVRNKCANYSIDYILRVYYKNGTGISSSIDNQCAGRQFAGYASSAFIFEFGEGLGKIVSFSGINKGFAPHDKESYINYKILACDSGTCSVEVDAALHGNTDQSPGGTDFVEKTHVISAKKDTSNPFVFYIRALYNGSYFDEMIEFASDGTISSRHDVTESYGFSVNIGITSIGESDYDLYLVGYFDREYNRFRVGMKASDSPGIILRTDEGTPLAFHQDKFKVTHNGGSTLAYPNSFFYSSSTYQTCLPGPNYCDSTSGSCTPNLTDCSLYLNLASPKSLRVSDGLANKDLKDEARCGDQEDYLLVGDFFYYCVDSCLNYFNSLTLETSGLTHTCENKLVFTDFGKTNHRCVVGFVDNASNCPDLLFAGSENYKFRYTSGDYVEQRYDCRDEYILKSTGETITTLESETGACGTCDYGTKKILETSSHLYYDDSGSQTAVRRKYCLDDCDIAPFLNKFIVDDGGTIKEYCSETCISANSVTDIPPGNLFGDPESSSKECRAYCDPARNHVTSLTDSSSIAAILAEPVCRSSCPTTHRAHEASFTDPSGTVVTHIYCLDTCTVEDKPFTIKTGDDRECLIACPRTAGFYFYESAADPQSCISECSSSKPYITGHHTHTGPASDITTGICKTACDDPDHFLHETTSGIFLCLEACLPERPFISTNRTCVASCSAINKVVRPFLGIISVIQHDSTTGGCETNCISTEFKYDIEINGTVERLCLPSECHTDKAFFDINKVCEPECPIGKKYLQLFSGIIATIEYNSAKGLCGTDCPDTTYFKYMSPSNTCFNCPGTCTEASINTRTDQIYAGTMTMADLNNGCTRVHCLATECHTDKAFFTPQKICHSDCPIRYKHLNPFTGIIDTIEYDSTKGLCDDDCPSNHFKYMPTTDSCTNADIAARIESIHDTTNSIDVTDLNNGCTKVYCLATECHTDKAFFTPDLICQPECPIRYKHLNPFTGIIDTIEYDSTKGLCDDDCPANHFKYMPTTDSCTNADIAARIESIHDTTNSIDVTDLNNGCTRVHCLATECHTDKAFFSPDLICQPECPIRYKHLNPFTGIIDTIEYDSTKGLCDDDCPANHFKYMPTTDSCTNADIAARIESIHDTTNSIDVTDLNNGCTKVYCLATECHTDKAFFTPDLICQPECPIRYKHLNPFTGIIDTIEYDSTKGLCDDDCPSNHFKYMNLTTTCTDCPDTCTEEKIANMIDEIHDPTNPKGVSELNNGCTRVHCLATECHTDKAFFSPDLICQPECPIRYKHLNPFTGIIDTIEYDSTKGLCDDDCQDNTFFKYMNPSTTCTDCPFECSEEAISNRIDNIYLGNAGVDDLNNGCARVHCIPNKCHEDKPFFTTDKVCVTECPLGAKHVQPFTGIIDPIEIDSKEGMCAPDCLSTQFKYTNPSTTCLDCPTDCTEESIIERIDNIYLGNATAADMNNGCTRLHCLPDNCPEDKPFFTEDKICVTECPQGARHVQPFTGIIDPIQLDSKKGMCMPDCLSTQFKYLHPTKTCKNCTTTCTQEFLDNLISEIDLGTKPKESLNITCTRAHCLTGECPEEAPFFTSDKICIEECPIGKKHLQTYAGVLDSVEKDSKKGYCASECANPNDYKYIDIKDTCFECPSDCIESKITEILDEVEKGSKPLSHANTICARLHCIPTVCTPPSGFFSINKICYYNCPPSISFVRKYPGVIDQMQPDSKTGLCTDGCDPIEFKYSVHSTNQQTICLDRCHDDKGFWDLDRYCYSECPTEAPFVNPEDPAVPLNLRIKRGICKTECDATLEYIYNMPQDSHQFYCLETCDQGKEYFIRRSNAKECLFECPIDQKFIHPLTKECLIVCPPEYKYYGSDWLCMEKCDYKIHGWLCAQNCPAELSYAVEQSCSSLCPNNLIGWACQPYCPPAYPNQVNRYCAKSCLDDQYLDEVSNFKESNESGICKTICNGFLVEGGEFLTGVVKSYCVPECPHLYLKEIRTSTEIWCREKCIRETIWMFELKQESCVSNCADYNFPYVNENYQCIESCSNYLDRDIWCVSECPAERPFVYDQHCVKECPGNAKFVEEFKFCVPKCELYNYDIFCVKECDDPLLIQYYIDNKLDYRPLGFVHSNLECAPACNEPGFEWINENNNHCVANCPLPCVDGVCPFPDMKFKEPTKYCREACNHKDYNFGDLALFECFSDCKPERPYYVEEYKFCLEKCPEAKPKVFLKSACNGLGVCESICQRQHSVCVASCPRETNYRMIKNEIEYCLCRCPQFYRILPGTNICVINCDEEKGLLANQAGDDCNACKDQNLFLWQGECIKECPNGTLSNPFNSCRTCKQLGLWQDHNLACLKFHECSELSLFDFSNQICTRCDGKGMMVRKVFPADFVCLQTDCADGHIVSGTVEKCFVCPPGWFFFSETCFKTCPSGFFNDYARWICTENCFESCSQECCVNGTCTLVQGLSECACKDGFFGEKCDIQKDSLEQTALAIQAALVDKLRDNLFSRADTNALVEFYFYAKALLVSRRRLLKVDPVLASNLRAFIEETRIPFAFQTEVLGLVDSLLLLEQLGVLQTGETASFESAVALLDSVTDDIQIFLTQNSEVGDFERVFEGNFRGQAFVFSFGTDIAEVSEVDVSKCLSRILERNSLAYGTKFPFKLLRFSSEVAQSVTRELSHAFNLSSTGRFELTLFLESGLYPLNEVCQENFVDTTEQVILEPEKKQSTQQFINIGVNVFDITVPFFNDKCVPYQSEDGKDLTLKERKAQLYKDPSELCNESTAKVCSVDGFSPEGEAICVCRGIQDKKKSSLQSFASTYPQTNYVLITCYDTFRDANVLRNVGFYVVFLSFIIFASMGIKSIFQSDSEIHSLKRFSFVRNDLEFFDPDRMKIETYFENCYNLKERLSLHVIEIAEKGELFRSLDDEEKNALFKVLPTVCDLKHLSFEQLLEYDRRSHLQFAIDIFTERNILFNTFYMDSLVFPKYFRIMFFVTEFNLSITLNAFFIDDELVENFNEQEDTGFLYSITNESMKTLWAFLTTKIIMTFFKGLYYVSSRNSSHLLRRMKSIEADYVKRAFNRFLLNTRVASLLFSFVVFLFNLACAYFVIIFCEIYRNSIDIWINGIYMGWIFDFVVLGGVVPLLLVGSRYLSTKNSSLSFLYKLSNLVDVMLSLGLN